MLGSLPTPHVESLNSLTKVKLKMVAYSAIVSRTYKVHLQCIGSEKEKMDKKFAFSHSYVKHSCFISK